MIVGLGQATAGGDDAASVARQRALAAIAEQIKVNISATLSSTEQSTTANGRSSGSQHVESNTTAQAAMTIEGAELLKSCQIDGSVFVVMGLDRAQFTQRATGRLQTSTGELKAAEARAKSAEAARQFLDAALAYNEASNVAQTLDDLADAIATVGKQARPATVWTTAGSLRQTAAALLTKASVVVKVTPEKGFESLRAAATSCLAYAGCPRWSRASILPRPSRST